MLDSEGAEVGDAEGAPPDGLGRRVKLLVGDGSGAVPPGPKQRGGKTAAGPNTVFGPRDCAGIKVPEMSDEANSMWKTEKTMAQVISSIPMVISHCAVAVIAT